MRRKTAVKDYDTKVPAEVRTANAEKLVQMENELEEALKAIKMFSAMKL